MLPWWVMWIAVVAFVLSVVATVGLWRLRKAGQPANAPAAAGAREPQPTSMLAFVLVVTMLLILFVLAAMLLIIPLAWRADGPGVVFLEYCKWFMSGLLGAFGAWIGAGAAYFFGRENLSESSRSTEEALRIQQRTLLGAVKPERLSQMGLTAMNPQFGFKNADTKKTITDALESHPDYWWVPVQGDDLKLEDVIHARVLLSSTFQDADPLSTIVSKIDTDAALVNLKKLHGEPFFVRVSIDDAVAEVSDKMEKSGAVVGIVVDTKGRAQYCFTKQNLMTARR